MAKLTGIIGGLLGDGGLEGLDLGLAGLDLVGQVLGAVLAVVVNRCLLLVAYI